MLHEFSSLVGLFCHLVGLLVIIYGTLRLIGGFMGIGGPQGILNGGLLLMFGTFLAGIAG